MYEIILSNKAKKQLSNFPPELRDRIGFALERIKIRPHHFVKRKTGTPHYILRIGNYRAILNILNDKLIIYVIEVGPRKNIYKN